jgi:hypothetical protein
MQHPLIVDLVGDGMMQNNPGIGIHGDLHIIGRPLTTSAKSHRSSFRFTFHDKASVILIQMLR